MAYGFVESEGEILGLLDADERGIVVDGLRQVDALLATADGEGDDDLESMLAQLEAHVTGEAGRSGADDADLEERDPALRRLLPAGHRDDEEAAREYRRMTEAGLVRGKRATIARALDALTAAPEIDPGRVHRAYPDLDVDLDDVRPLVLDATQGSALLVALTDLRLVLAERLGLRTDDDADRLVVEMRDADPDDPRTFLVAVYDFLGWFQESLVQTLTEVG